jgi:hypothetical protein
MTTGWFLKRRRIDLGFSHVTISKIETCKQDVPIRILSIYANTLHIAPRKLAKIMADDYYDDILEGM